jgi:PKHD-type hydroxylase
MIKHSYWLWDSEISKDICNNIVSSTKWDLGENAVVGEEPIVNNDKRKSNIVWSPRLSLIWCLCSSYIQTANVSADWQFYLHDLPPIQLTEYADDGHYDWHADAYPPNENNMQRKLSVSILLNDPNEFEGGEFEFRNCKPELKQGSILVFPSFLDHKVTPVTSGTRYSAVGWMEGPAFR